MPKSLSNGDALVKELQEIVARYQSKPSPLLAELEHFIRVNGLSWESHSTPPMEPAWKVMGFNSKKEFDDFESRSDFPGWDAL